MYKLILKPHEIEVLRLRYDGFTYQECANRLGYKHYTQAQELYKNTLKKIRTWKDLEQHNIEILRAAKKLGKSQKYVLQLYRHMERARILYRWKRMSKEKLLECEGIGTYRVEFLMEAQKECSVTNLW